VYDLQYRLRCQHCNRRSGFRIAVVDGRERGDNSVQMPERVIVTGEISAKPRPQAAVPRLPTGTNCAVTESSRAPNNGRASNYSHLRFFIEKLRAPQSGAVH
jgi:hypothetical protein